MADGTVVLTPIALLDLPGLSPAAKIVCQRLMAHLNRRSAQCNPRQPTLARELKLSVRTVGRAIRTLRERGLIMTHKGQRGSSYRVLFGQDDRAGTVLFGQDDRARPVKMTEQDSASLYEPDGLNHKVATDAADKGSSSLQGGGRRAAAAAGGVGAYKPEPARPAMRESMRDAGENADACGRPPAKTGDKGGDRTRRSDSGPAAGARHANIPRAVVEAAGELVAELLGQHPEPGNPERAVDEAQRLLAASAEPEATIRVIRQNHGAWLKHWATLSPQRFIPQLWRWFASGEWKFLPVERKGVARETAWERTQRLIRESDEKEYLELALDGKWDELEGRVGEAKLEVWRAKVAVA